MTGPAETGFVLRSLRSPALTVAAALLAVAASQAGSASAQSSTPSLPAPSRGAFVAAETVDRPVGALVAARAAAAARAAESARAQADEAARVAAEQEARAQEASLCSGDGWQARRGAAALASLGPRALDSGWRVEFAPGRSGYMGLAHLQRRVVEVFVRSCDSQSDELLRHVIAHELGHAFDTARLTDADRAAWKAARGIPASVDWYGCSGCTDFATPAGDFAEVYAQWLRGSAGNRSEIAGSPGPAELAALADRFFG